MNLISKDNMPWKNWIDIRLMLLFQIDELNPEILCPPESNGEGLELALQILCVIMALLIAILVFNLSYDYYFYRKTGKLPNCALFFTCDPTWYTQTRYTFGFGNRNGSQISQ